MSDAGQAAPRKERLITSSPKSRRPVINTSMAHKAVHAVIDHIKLALVRGEPVQVSFGWLVVKRLKQCRVFRLGRIVDIPKHPWTITLRKRATEPRRRKVKVKPPVPQPRYPAQVTFASSAMAAAPGPFPYPGIRSLRSPESNKDLPTATALNGQAWMPSTHPLRILRA